MSTVGRQRLAEALRPVVGRYKIEAGIIRRGAVRRFLAEQKFRQRPGFLEYQEVKGCLDSTFLIRLQGPQAAVQGWMAATGDLFREAEDA